MTILHDFFYTTHIVQNQDKWQGKQWNNIIPRIAHQNQNRGLELCYPHSFHLDLGWIPLPLFAQLEGHLSLS